MSSAEDTLDLNPMYTLAGHAQVPKHRIPDGELNPISAYRVVHDELMLDGNARLNTATFVSTWMEDQARLLMAEAVDKNMIDKDEYPQTAELERRCVNMLADLWHAHDPAHPLNRASIRRILLQRKVRAGAVVVAHVGRHRATQMRISRSTYGFCQGLRGAVGRSRMPIARMRRLNGSP